MKFIIPKYLMGTPIAGSLERALAGNPQNPPTPPTPPATPAVGISNPKNYIILEGKSYGKYNYTDTFVSMELSHKGDTWYKAHEALAQEGAFMLSIRQFVDFLKLLKTGKAFDGNGNPISKPRLDSILESIIAFRDSWRAEWLDADFKLQGKNIVMNYEHRIVNGKLAANRPNELLEGYLAKDKTPGIDFNSWLSNATYQGLPPDNIGNGALHYWQPRKDNNSVASFNADSGGAILHCGGYPTYSYGNLGVRVARKKI